MRKTAGFLKFGATFALIIEIIAAIIIAGLEVLFLVIGNFSDIAARTGNAITISGGTMTPAEMDALKPIIVVALGIALVSVIMNILGTVKTRKALGECKKERPFSAECVASIKSAANLEIIGGIIGIAGSLILAFMASSITVNGTSVAGTSTTLNLSFLIHAIEKYLFYHVASYGHSLENR